MATAEHELDRNGIGHGRALTALLAGLPHTVVIEQGDDTLTWDVAAFLERPVPHSIRGRTEMRLLCRITPAGMLLVGLSEAAACEIVARGYGETVVGGVLLRVPTSDEELGACRGFIEQAYESLSIGNGVARTYLKPLLPNFSRTRLQ